MTERYAIVSVTDKTGLVQFVEKLQNFQYRIISTGGTGNVLRENGVEVIPIEEWTGSPEMLGGRVKTLHPAVHGGILAKREDSGQMKELKEQGLKPIDMVVVNLYEFEEAASSGAKGQELMGEVDIGGPTLLRSAAKNYSSVAAVSDPSQYNGVISELETNEGELSPTFRKQLAATAFQRTSKYDNTIHGELTRQEGKDTATLIEDNVRINLDRSRELRYGENPHQEAGLFLSMEPSEGFAGSARSIHGKELSYNNMLDMDAAYRLLGEFDSGKPACAVMKHMIPCGAAIADRSEAAFRQAHEGDPVSAFGSIVGFNTTVTVDVAEHLASDDYYIEGIVAPSFEKGVAEIFEEGPGWGSRVRLVPVNEIQDARKYVEEIEVRTLSGGYLLQQQDGTIWEEDELEVVSGKMTENLKKRLEFAWKVCKHVRSNAIVLARDWKVAGVGAGQPSRVDSAKIAARKANGQAAGGVMASDAFFPFPDALEVGIEAGIEAVVQPGGSVNDDAVIEAARDAGVTMLMTGQRHFRH